MSGTEEKTAFPEPLQSGPELDEKDFTRQSLDRVFSRNRGGFYFLIASPRTQAAALERYRGGNVAVYDFGQAKEEEQGRHIIQILRLTQREPDRDVYVYQNFQLALWDSGARDGVGDWDIDAIHRLNYSRDQLNNLRKRMVFCMTREADDQLNRHAMDFYDFVQLFLRLEDEPEERPTVERVRPVDRSVGVDVKVDFSQDEETLLNQAIALGNQAEEMMDSFRYGDAFYLLEKQRSIREALLGEQHIDTAETYCKLALFHSRIDENEEALNWYKKALPVQENILGMNHPRTARTIDEIGYSYYGTGDYYSAAIWHEKAVKIYENIASTNTQSYLYNYKELNYTTFYKGEDNSELVWYRNAAKAIEQQFGLWHPKTANIYEKVGRTYDGMGMFSSALNWHNKARCVRERILGRGHLDTIRAYENIRNVYYRMGNYTQAISESQKMKNLLCNAGFYNEALKSETMLLAFLEKDFGANNNYTISVYNSIASIYSEMGDTAAATEWRKKAEAARDAETPPAE